MKNKLATGLLLSIGSLLVSQQALANTAWVGTANYLAAPGASTTDEAFVGPFDTYDFGPGIGLIKPVTTAAVGNLFTGSFQTVVTSHILDGAAINTPQLNVSGGSTPFPGNNNGFELTVRSTFTGQYTSVGPNLLGVIITGGTAGLYFDTNPNYSFANDSGFANGALILSGTITGGEGFVSKPATLGSGFETIDLDLTGGFGSYDTNVYEPDTIAGGAALFALKVKTATNSTPIINQVANGQNKVGGVSAVGGQLFQIDGQLQLTAAPVPLPGSAWLFLSAMMGLISVNRKNRSV